MCMGPRRARSYPLTGWPYCSRAAVKSTLGLHVAGANDDAQFHVQTDEIGSSYRANQEMQD